MIFVKNSRGGREVNMINTLSKINLSKIGWEGGRSTSIWIMSLIYTVFFGDHPLDGFVRGVHLKGYKQVLAGSSSSWHLYGSLWVSASLGRSLRVLVGLDRSWWVLAFQRVSEGPSGSWRVYAGLGGS